MNYSYALNSFRRLARVNRGDCARQRRHRGHTGHQFPQAGSDKKTCFAVTCITLTNWPFRSVGRQVPRHGKSRGTWELGSQKISNLTENVGKTRIISPYQNHIWKYSDSPSINPLFSALLRECCYRFTLKMENYFTIYFVIRRHIQ